MPFLHQTLCLILNIYLVKADPIYKKSRIFEGTVSEPKTLKTMIKGLAGKDINEDYLIKPTIVLDAGIATEDNIKWLKGKPYHYIDKKKKVSYQYSESLSSSLNYYMLRPAVYDELPVCFWSVHETTFNQI